MQELPRSGLDVQSSSKAYFPVSRLRYSKISRSAAKLAYKNAQDAIEGKILGDILVAPEHDISAIQNDIKVLHDISKILHEVRFKNGALSTTSLRLSFKLDANGNPVDCGQYEQTEAHRLVEEVRLCT
jgi:protein SSD1